MNIEDLPKGKKIILFDGFCNLCDAAVQFIIKHDKKDCCRFVSLQSELSQKIIKHIGIDSTKIDSIVLYEPGSAYYLKANAAFKIAESLNGLYPLLNSFSIFPSYITNLVYDYIAKNRYKWYGKKEQCLLPSLENNSKFLA
jgi:predicted DCC family thiol-disulfide oxidoreductase YuxK